MDIGWSYDSEYINNSLLKLYAFLLNTPYAQAVKLLCLHIRYVKIQNE